MYGLVSARSCRSALQLVHISAYLTPVNNEIHAVFQVAHNGQKLLPRILYSQSEVYQMVPTDILLFGSIPNMTAESPKPSPIVGFHAFAFHEIALIYGY